MCPPLTTVSPDTAGSGNEAIGSDSVTTTVELPDIVAVACGEVGTIGTAAPATGAREQRDDDRAEQRDGDGDPPHGGACGYQR